MTFNLGVALLVGGLAGAAMLGYRAGLRRAGLRLELDVAVIWGTMLLPRGSAAYLAGLGLHLIGSGVLALPYAWTMSLASTARGDAWAWGAALGLIHWLMAGITMGLVPRVHPRIPAAHPRPGWFVTAFGWDSAAVFLGGHVLYGLLAGVLYGWLA